MGFSFPIGKPALPTLHRVLSKLLTQIERILLRSTEGSETNRIEYGTKVEPLSPEARKDQVALNQSVNLDNIIKSCHNWFDLWVASTFVIVGNNEVLFPTIIIPENKIFQSASVVRLIGNRLNHFTFHFYIRRWKVSLHLWSNENPSVRFCPGSNLTFGTCWMDLPNNSPSNSACYCRYIQSYVRCMSTVMRNQCLLNYAD